MKKLLVILTLISLMVIMIMTTACHPWRIAEPPEGAWIGVTEEEVELLKAGCTLPPDTNAVQVTAKPQP